MWGWDADFKTGFLGNADSIYKTMMASELGKCSPQRHFQCAFTSKCNCKNMDKTQD